jgi:hypothetical protein
LTDCRQDLELLSTILSTHDSLLKATPLSPILATSVLVQSEKGNVDHELLEVLNGFNCRFKITKSLLSKQLKTLNQYQDRGKILKGGTWVLRRVSMSGTLCSLFGEAEALVAVEL